jgi:hypothetical protein
MKELEMKKALLKINEMIVQDIIESLATKYKIPVEKLKKIVTMSKLNGRLERSLEMEEMILNISKVIEKE